MKLLHLHIEQFGKLHDVSMELEEGLNVLCRENGWGKSTLAVFIKAMLYGLPATTKRSLDENERKKYTPRQGGRYGGSLHFVTARGSFRVERFFGAKESEDTFALYDLRTNLPSTVYTERLGIELFGIDAEGFERSSYLSQRDIDDTKETHSITTKLTDLLDEVDDIGSYERAETLLDKRRKFYFMPGDKGAIADTKRRVQALERELEDCARKEARLQELEAEYALLTAGIAEVEAQLSSLRERRTKASEQWKKQGDAKARSVMVEAIAAKEARLEAIRRAYGGHLPTPAEAEEAQARVSELELNARQQAALGEAKVSGRALPSGEHLARAEKDNEDLKKLITLYTARREDHSTLSASVERGKSLPCAEELAEVERALERLDAAPASAPPKKMGKLALVSGLLLFVGGLAAALWIHPAAVALTAVGALLILVWCIGARKASHASLDALRSEVDVSGAKQTIRTFLAKYNVQPGDARAALEELRYALRTQKDNERLLLQKAEELKLLRGQIDARSRVLSAFFAQYGKEPTEGTRDFGPFIEQLRAALTEAASEADRQRARETLARDGERLKTALAPFLGAYFPSGVSALGKELTTLVARVREAEQLLRELGESKERLSAFDRAHPTVPSSAQMTTDTPEALDAEEQRLLATLAERRREKESYDHQMRPLYEVVEGICERETEKREQEERLRTYEADFKTLKKTEELLKRAKTELSTRYLGGVREAFEHYLELLNGETATVTVDTSFEVRIEEGGSLQPMESFSRGQRDLVRFCMRLSLCRALAGEGEKPLLLLDDPFINLDNSRMDAARALLDKLAEEYQILYMVCHSDRT